MEKEEREDKCDPSWEKGGSVLLNYPELPRLGLTEESRTTDFRLGLFVLVFNEKNELCTTMNISKRLVDLDLNHPFPMTGHKYNMQMCINMNMARNMREGKNKGRKKKMKTIILESKKRKLKNIFEKTYKNQFNKKRKKEILMKEKEKRKDKNIQRSDYILLQKELDMDEWKMSENKAVKTT